LRISLVVLLASRWPCHEPACRSSLRLDFLRSPVMPHSCASRRISPVVLPGTLTGFSPARLSFLVFRGNIPHRILKTHVAFSCFFVSVRRTVFVSVSAAEAVGFRRADPYGRCNSIKPLCGSASRKSRQRFAAFAAFVVAAKRLLSEAQKLNDSLYNFSSSLQLKTTLRIPKFESQMPYQLFRGTVLSC
jgi:hypothetical protein